MDDDAKGPGPFQQRGASAAEPEETVAEGMDGAMDGNPVTTTPKNELKGNSRRQTQGGPRSTDATKKRNANTMNKRRTRKTTETGWGDGMTH